MAQVLVIDPRPNTVKQCRQMLVGRGHRVNSYAKFEDGLKHITKLQPDAVLVNPEACEGRSSEEIVQELQKLQAKTLVFLVMSNRVEEHLLTEAFESGAADVLFTPLVAAEVAGRISSKLKSKQSPRIAPPRRPSSQPPGQRPPTRPVARRQERNSKGPKKRRSSRRKPVEYSNVEAPDILPNGELTGKGVLKLAISKQDKKLAGRIFDRYRLVKTLGIGGMGVVIEAIQRETGNKVALKVLRADLEEEPEAPLRFLREAYVLQGIRDKHVVKLIDIGRAGGTSFYAMEYVEGITLADLLDDRTRLHVGDACHIAAGIARALAALGACNIVHRDLKPGNIFLSNDLRVVKLGDFGLAKRARARDVTPNKSLIGTPHYIAPEVVSGEVATITSDVYSLGVVFHEMLSGRPLHGQEPTVTLLYKIVYGNPPNVHDSLKGIPEPVRAMVDHATQRYPEERVQNISEYARGLERLALQFQRRRRGPGSNPTTSRRLKRPPGLQQSSQPGINPRSSSNIKSQRQSGHGRSQHSV